MLGAGRWRVLRDIVLPALRPSIVSAVILVFLFCATSFGVVLTLGGLRYSTVETEIYLQTVQLLDLRTAAVLSLLQLVIVIGAPGHDPPARPSGGAGSGHLDGCSPTGPPRPPRPAPGVPFSRLS